MLLSHLFEPERFLPHSTKLMRLRLIKKSTADRLETGREGGLV
jgi:hypothetical protein